MSMTVNVSTGINTLQETDARAAAVTIRTELNSFNAGDAPHRDENKAVLEAPFMVWRLVGGPEDYTFDTNSIDYYQDVDVIFAIVYRSKSAKEAGILGGLLKSLFRNQELPLPAGRVLCAQINEDFPQQSDDSDGQTEFVSITFQTGT